MIDCDDVRAALLLGPLHADATDHVRTCARCAAEEPLVRALAGALTAYAVPAPPPGLGARVLAAAAPILAERVPRIEWGRVARAIGAALLPLPLIVFVQVHVLRGAYELLSVLLPRPLSVYLVANYAVLLVLLLTITYAAVPLLAARQTHSRPEAVHA